MMQLRTRPDDCRGIPAVANEPPQPIERRTIEAEFYDALEDGAEDATFSLQATVEMEGGGVCAPGTSGPALQSREAAHGGSQSPARRLAAPMFIATCLLLGLLAHGADANRFLSFWPQREAPLPQAEAAPLFSGAWRQIGRYRDEATSVREAVTVSADTGQPAEERPLQKSPADEREPAATPEEPPATRPADVEEGAALFVPMAIDLICAIPVVFDLTGPEPGIAELPEAPLASLTELYPFEPWSIRPGDAGPVGRAQVAVQAVVTGAWITTLPRPEAQAPAAPPAKAAVRPKPESKPAGPTKAQPVSASKPASGPSTPSWSQDAFRF